MTRYEIITNSGPNLDKTADGYGTNVHGDLLLFNESVEGPVATINRDRWLTIEPEEPV